MGGSDQSDDLDVQPPVYELFLYHKRPKLVAGVPQYNTKLLDIKPSNNPPKVLLIPTIYRTNCQHIVKYKNKTAYFAYFRDIENFLQFSLDFDNLSGINNIV